MKKKLVALLLLAFLTACAGINSQLVTETAAPSPTDTALPTETPTPSPTATPNYPPEGYGPTGFPVDVNPLTGLEVTDPALLERRPLAIKVSNLPRSVRPQWGLSLADIVFEYYTEQGSSRFIALFYGNDAEIVGPIRSARFFDVHVVRGYKAVFAFGSAWEKVLNRLFGSEFADRLVLEWSAGSPMTRYDPNGYNHLIVDTAALSEYMTSKGVENGRQNLDGMYFRMDVPAEGEVAEMLYVRYSSAIYGRWDYDPATGKYIRYADSAEDPSNGAQEVYELQTDRLTGETLAFDNVVVLEMFHEYYTVDVWDIQFTGSGTAYAFRDGQVYQLKWWRVEPEAVLSLTWPDGTPFPFKPGTTWFEVIGQNSKIDQDGPIWRFTHKMP
jgi:hypothetical protein